jgi:hypothetical protein
MTRRPTSGSKIKAQICALIGLLSPRCCRREARDMRRDNPRIRVWWPPCPICGSSACRSETCREAERHASRWRHVAEPASSNGEGRP